MCGKFTAMLSWSELHAVSQSMTGVADGEGSNDEVVTYRPMDGLPVIFLDRETGQRRVVPMRWSYPDGNNPAPRHMHARAETIDTKKTWAPDFLDGRRGIVVFRTFNEGKEISKSKTEQWTIDPQDGIPRGFAFLFHRFELGGEPPFLACVMAIVRANELIRRTIMQDDPDPRMPAILENEDWAKWLGEEPASHDEVKSVLRTMEGVNWKIAPEPKGPKAKRAPTPPKPKAEKPEPPPTLF